MRKGGGSGSGSCSLSSRLQERNLREKGRRMELKLLLAKLLSLLPSLNPFTVSTFNTLHQAVVYIKQLEERLANLNTRKQELLLHQVEETGSGNCSSDGSRQVQVRIQDSGSVMEVNLVGGSHSNISLPQVIRIVEDGGAVVVAANYCRTTTNNIIYTIHSEEICGRIGIDTSTVMERLGELSI